MEHLLLVENAKQLVVVCSNGELYKRGAAQKEVIFEQKSLVIIMQVDIIENGSMVIGSDGKIVAVGKAEEIKQKYEGHAFKEVIDATGKCILPGFVDSHTHPVWSGDRCHEFAMKLAGIFDVVTFPKFLRCYLHGHS